jgi:hypothetical protein
MLSYILNQIIQETFERHVGKMQKDNPKPKGLLIKFQTRLDYEKEDGWRKRELLIYADYNYVGVYTRTCWNVRSVAGLLPTTAQGASDWEALSYHDSCWRDGVSRFIIEHEDEFVSIGSTFNDWYEVVEISDFLQGTLKAARDKKYNKV